MLSSECAGHGGHRDLSYAGPGRRTIPLDVWGCRGDLAQFGVAAASVLGFAKAWQHDTVLSVPDDETGLVDGAVCVCHLRVDALYIISVSDDGTALHENELCRKCVERDGGNVGVFQTWERSECAVDRESDGEHYAVWLCAAGSVAAVPLHPLPGNRGIVLGLLYSMYGVLLDPRVLGAILHKEEYEMYQINILIGWISPLSHVTYAKHNFGYDRFPMVGQSCLLFTGILLVLSVICMRAMRRYSFRFLGERS